MSAAVGDQGRKRRTLLLLAGLAVGMFGFGFALVPLYSLLCQVTGIQSVGQRATLGASPAAATASAGTGERWVTVKFDATVHPDLPWSLGPMVRKVRVQPGETQVISFVAENRSGQQVTGQAIPTIAPFQANGFFSKMECFCFTQQTLAGGERREMPLQFVISPDLPADIASLTLSYSVMRIPNPTPVAVAD
jgi:cytochrome c oxidase assembly protein subunit 11